jgi:hypothetical protein
MASSLVPGPVATTVPFCGFSLAVSGMIIPDAVVVSAACGAITTRSAKGLILIVLMYKNLVYKIISINCAITKIKKKAVKS